jgi:hypothetical protein
MTTATLEVFVWIMADLVRSGLAAHPAANACGLPESEPVAQSGPPAESNEQQWILGRTT